MSRQCLRHGASALWPRAIVPGRKSFLAEPKTLGVIDEALQGATALSAEHEQRPIQRIGLEGLAAEGGKTIDAPTKIDRLNRQQDPHLWGDLNHGGDLQNERAKATQAAGS